MSAYYNEFDPKAAAWLRELISAGLIAPGDVDTRSIKEVSPHELTGYTQQHFFAGIGGWSLALRLAGWPDSQPVRTGSCPCQPFSQAGKGKGEADERHLWPVFRDLITFGAPTVTFGEQVASALGRQWLARVRLDLEGLGYGVGAADLCAASVGAPHIRQRLFWVADPRHESAGRRSRSSKAKSGSSFGESPRRGTTFGMADSSCEQTKPADTTGLHAKPSGGCTHGRLADSDGGHSCAEWEQCSGQQRQQQEDRGVGGFWSAFDLLPCTDGKSRRIEPGSFPLVDGLPGRMVLLRGYGNAIVPQVGAEFIKAFVDVTP